MFSALSKKNSPLATGSSTSMAPIVVDWAHRLEVALDNDESLLALLTENPPIEIKLAAVQALRAEEALKQAEREFRTHDRRVHSVAKQCYERSVSQRKMRARADELIAEATAVSGELMIPANRLVELDQAWRALDTALLHPDQRTQFGDLQDALVKHVRDLGERQRDISRWCVDARQSLVTVAEFRAQLSDATHEVPDLLSGLTAVTADVRSRLDQITALLPVVGSDARNASMLAGQLTAAFNDTHLIEAKLKLLSEFQTANPNSGKPARKDPASTDQSPQVKWQSITGISEPSVVEALDRRQRAGRANQDIVAASGRGCTP